jgi:hypothetical protein
MEFHMKRRFTCRGREKGKANKVACVCHLAGLDMLFDPAYRHSNFSLFLRIVLCVRYKNVYTIPTS